LPDVKAGFISVEQLLPALQSAEGQGCRDDSDRAQVTLLDMRTEHHLSEDASDRSTITEIKTSCSIVSCLLDELQNPRIRRQIPKSGLVVTVTETGNRDAFAIQYLSKFGYANLKVLRFGMRGWIKKGYPVETRSLSEKP
jgi:rhodanese-related sulfurtransferase